MPVLTYGLEAITITRKSADRLQTTQRTTGRAIHGITLRDSDRSDEIRRRTKVPNVLGTVGKLKRRLDGHITRQDPDR